MRQIQLLVDGKVIAEPTVTAQVPGTEIDLTFSSAEEAKAFVASLTTR